MEFYKILLEIMAEKNLTISAVAAKCALTDSTVRSIIGRKQKRVSLDVAFKLKEGLNVSLERLNGEAVSLLDPNLDSSKNTNTNIFDERLNSIIENFNQLNDAGKDDLVKHSEHLTYIPEYKKCDSVCEESQVS